MTVIPALVHLILSSAPKTVLLSMRWTKAGITGTMLLVQIDIKVWWYYSFSNDCIVFRQADNAVICSI